LGPEDAIDPDEEVPPHERPFKDPGFKFGDPEGAWHVHLWWRAQLRWSDPFDGTPRTLEGLRIPPGEDFDLRRSRFKIRGHLIDPRIGFYFEHELGRPHPLLDLRLDLRLGRELRMRVGQFKVLYNRERVDSSGKQQFVERSVANYAFTLDRQRGANLYRRFRKGTIADSVVTLGVFEGDGRNPGPRGGDPMIMVRWQWQMLGENVPFTQSDWEFTQRAALSLSLAGARVRGPYTRYSTSGGGQLSGFESGGVERYTLEQWQQGFAWKWNGWSAQQEYHEKHIQDHETGRRSMLRGGYAQIGKAWAVRGVERRLPLELAFRYARVDWENTPQDRDQKEYSMVGNLFLRGHDSKFSMELSRVALTEQDRGSDAETRVRLQWDVSF